MFGSVWFRKSLVLMVYSVCLQHYSAVMRYVSQGPLLVDVHMHKPMAASRNFMDALLAFWPGLQVSATWIHSTQRS